MTSSIFVCLLKSRSVTPVSVETAVRPSSPSVFAQRVLLAEHRLKLPSRLWSVGSDGLIVEGVESPPAGHQGSDTTGGPDKAHFPAKWR